MGKSFKEDDWGNDNNEELHGGEISCISILQFVDRQYDILAMLAIFSEDSAFVMNEDENNEEVHNRIHGENLEARLHSDIGFNLAELDNLSVSGSSVCSCYNANCLQGDFMELMDLEVPLQDDYKELVDLEVPLQCDYVELMDLKATSQRDYIELMDLEVPLQSDYVELIDLESL